ncbi:MAG: 1,4-alpha-glucan branching enzyme, partial [Thiohalorhabdaceae bacterium]
MPPSTTPIAPHLHALTQGRLSDPFTVLGHHLEGPENVVRTFLPGASEVSVEELDKPLERLPETDLFELRGSLGNLPQHYRLAWTDSHGQRHSAFDPYTFEPQLADFDLYLFGEGRHWHAYRFLGARAHQADGIDGVLFAVWAPNAGRVSVVGHFNDWDGRRHPMRVRGESGVWELFIPELEAGELYKFEIRNGETGEIQTKTDPYGRKFEVRPQTAAIVEADPDYHWADGDWMDRRPNWDWRHAPMSVYEVHLGAWCLA